jgi:hypothetical protein
MYVDDLPAASIQVEDLPALDFVIEPQARAS